MASSKSARRKRKKAAKKKEKKARSSGKPISSRAFAAATGGRNPFAGKRARIGSGGKASSDPSRSS